MRNPRFAVANVPACARPRLTIPVPSEPGPILDRPPVNERITATPIDSASGAANATLPGALWCDWWPWLYAIEAAPRPWGNLTPLPPVSVSTDTQ
jgi:hypothetical protein